jgi:formate hydrogenlyase subunit 3/multisubunit Na+/H+ antiporter MnhD subunit
VTTLESNVVFTVVGGLILLAGWLATNRRSPRQTGLAAGVFFAMLAGAVLELGQAPRWLVLDAVAMPRLAIVALTTLAVFAVMPARETSWHRTIPIVLLMASDIVLVVVSTPTASAVAWAASCGLSLAVLPEGASRRLAVPYLALAAGAGIAGLTLSGQAGAYLLLLAVAVRLGVFPFHSWIVAAYHLAPTTVAVAVAGPMSAVALVARAPLGLDGTAGTTLSILLAGSALVAAGLAIVQQGLARSVGFLTVSVQTIVLVGLLDADDIGHLGGLMMWNLTGLSLVGLGLVVASLRSRVGHVRLDEYAGLLSQVPVFATVFLLFGLAAVGAPGTADFASEDLVLHGAIAHHPALLVLFISAVSAQGYGVLHLFFRVFYGPPGGLVLADALPREKLALIALGALLIASGLAPQLAVDGWIGTTHPEASQHASLP